MAPIATGEQPPILHDTRLITLTQGKSAIVDDNDYDRLAQFKWSALRGSRTRWYAVRWSATVNGKRHRIYMHREVLGIVDGLECDHKEGVGLDNRKSNLRPATHGQNQRNKGMLPSNTSGYIGVYFRKSSNKWFAQIKYNGQIAYLGAYITKEEAAAARDAKALELHGEFAVLNFKE